MGLSVVTTRIPGSGGQEKLFKKKENFNKSAELEIEEYLMWQYTWAKSHIKHGNAT